MQQVIVVRCAPSTGVRCEQIAAVSSEISEPVSSSRLSRPVDAIMYVSRLAGLSSSVVGKCA